MIISRKMSESLIGFWAVVFCLNMIVTINVSAAVAAGSDAGAKSGFVILRPETWIGQRFPLLEDIDIGKELASGKWTVVLYRDGTAASREFLPRYIKTAEDISSWRKDVRFAFIEMPPYRRWYVKSPLSSPVCVGGRLSNARRWFVNAPIRVEMDNGQVSSAYTEPAQNAFLPRSKRPLVKVSSFLVDLGGIPEDRTTEAKVSIKNSGKTPVFLRSRTTCSCTSSEPGTDLLFPGQSTELFIRFDARERTEKKEPFFRETAYLVSSTDKEKYLESIIVQGEIKKTEAK